MSKDVLSNWTNLNKNINNLSEKECAEALQKEKKGERRLTFLLRLYGRFSVLRMKREREDLLS